MKETKGGKKNDKGKLRMDLIPAGSLRQVAEVLTFGANKYGDRNWEKGLDCSRLYGALLRHLTSWWLGQDKDDESGLNHLAHTACTALMLLDMATNRPEHDDRPK